MDLTAHGRQMTGAMSALRRSRAAGAVFFVVLVLLVAGERRLAEAQFNVRPAAPCLENDDVLDGDEVRVRLIVLNDDRAPTITDVRRVVAIPAAHVVPPRPDRPPGGRPAPRGPPVPSSSRG